MEIDVFFGSSSGNVSYGVSIAFVFRDTDLEILSTCDFEVKRRGIFAFTFDY